MRPSICEYECDKSCNIGQYLDYKNCKCRKELTDKLVENFSEDINGKEIIYNVTLSDYEKVCKSCTICIVLLFITFIIIIGIKSGFFYFYRLKKKIISMEYINSVTTCAKLLYYIKSNVSEGIDVNKSNKSKECMICHYWYISDENYKYEPQICNGCQDISIMAYELENIAIRNFKCIDYSCVIWNITKYDAINWSYNSELDDNGTALCYNKTPIEVTK